MTSENLKGLILSKITTHRGLKEEDLIDFITDEVEGIKATEIARTISELVQSGEMKRIEYLLPDYKGCFFSFYLPQNSRIQ